MDNDVEVTMSNDVEVTNHKHDSFGSVRSVYCNGEPWYFVKDIAPFFNVRDSQIYYYINKCVGCYDKQKMRIGHYRYSLVNTDGLVALLYRLGMSRAYSKERCDALYELVHTICRDMASEHSDDEPMVAQEDTKQEPMEAAEDPAMSESKDLMVFENEEFGKVRTILKDGEPWFVGKDVADILGYNNSRDALSKHVDKEDRNTVAIRDGIKGNPNQTIINESGVYSLILSSKLPKAKRFKRWVTSEVLPCIRKNGYYAITKPDSYMIDDPVERATRWIEERKELDAANNKIKELAPKAQIAEDFIEAGHTVTFRELCKQIKIKEPHMRKIFGLINFAYSTKGKIKKWMPRPDTIKKGYAVMKDAYVDRIGAPIAIMRITMEGKEYLKKIVSFYRESGLLDDWDNGINSDYQLSY